MANIALNKLPLEIETWKKSEIATNGDAKNYDGANGYSHAEWPCTYTLDLDSEKKIKSIRFLLWDNLGKNKTVVDPRKYKFTLSISSDGITYTDIYSNRDEEGGNGWFIFRFLNDTYFRFVKLTGHYNSANKSFHIVEFEIHDNDTDNPPSKNISNFDIITGVVGERKIKELIDNIIAQRSSVFTGLQEKIDQIDKSLLKSNEAYEKIELIKKTHDYLREAETNNTHSKYWLIAASVTFIAFIGSLYYFIYCDQHAKSIIEEYSKTNDLKSFISVILAAYYFSKAVFLSVFLYVFSWLLKNYRSVRHNYVINKHKAMSLTVASGVLVGDDYKNTDRSKIFTQAMDIIFSHQNSGFSKEESSAPNLISTVLNKGLPKEGP